LIYVKCTPKQAVIYVECTPKQAVIYVELLRLLKFESDMDIMTFNWRLVVIALGLCQFV